MPDRVDTGRRRAVNLDRCDDDAGPRRASVPRPYIAEVVVELGDRGFDYAEEFEFGLDFILERLERYKKTFRSERRSR